MFALVRERNFPKESLVLVSRIYESPFVVLSIVIISIVSQQQQYLFISSPRSAAAAAAGDGVLVLSLPLLLPCCWLLMAGIHHL